MAKRKRPKRIKVGKEVFILQVFLINTKHPDDKTFMNVTRIPDDHKVDLAGGEEFIGMYVPQSMLTLEEKEEEK